jgi:hypothetical protein
MKDTNLIEGLNRDLAHELAAVCRSIQLRQLGGGRVTAPVSSGPLGTPAKKAAA